MDNEIREYIGGAEISEYDWVFAWDRFGVDVFDARQAMGCTQRALSEATKICSQGFISDIEQGEGEQNHKLHYVIAICNALHLDVRAYFEIERKRD